MRDEREVVGPPQVQPGWPDDHRQLTGAAYDAAIVETEAKHQERAERETARLSGALRYAPPALRGKFARWIEGGVEREDPLGAVSTPCEHGKRKIKLDTDKLTIATVADPREDDEDKRKRIKGEYPCACGKALTVHVREGSPDVYIPHHVPPNPVRVEREGPLREWDVKGLPVRDIDPDTVAVGVAFFGGSTLGVPKLWGQRDLPDVRALRDSGAERVTRRGKVAEYVIPTIPEGMRVNARNAKAAESLLKKAARLKKKGFAPLAEQIANRAEIARSMIDERRAPTLDSKARTLRSGLLDERDTQIDAIDRFATEIRKGLAKGPSDERERIADEAREARDKVQREIDRAVGDVERLARERLKTHERIAAEAGQLVREARKLGEVGTALIKAMPKVEKTVEDPGKSVKRTITVDDLAARRSRDVVRARITTHAASCVADPRLAAPIRNMLAF